MKPLDQIFNENGTDKGSAHPIVSHNYAPFYELLLHEWRLRPIKMLEIGVGGGESICSWLEYFPEAKVWGVDIVHDTNPWNDPKSSADPRYTFVHHNQDDPTGWQCFLADQGGDWDLIIDDGSHENTGIITSFNSLWPAIKPDGFYIVEDLGAGYTPGSVHVKPGVPTHKEWLGGLVESLHTGAAGWDFLMFAREIMAAHKPGPA